MCSVRSEMCCCFFLFQAEDSIRDAQESRGLGDVYKRQGIPRKAEIRHPKKEAQRITVWPASFDHTGTSGSCLLYTSDAADDLHCVDVGGRRIIEKKNDKALLYWKE